MLVALLVGGAGTRLYPLTAYVPKCMIPIGGKLVIDHVIEYLKKHGLKDIVLLVSKDDCDVFKNYLGGGDRHAVSIRYSVAPRIGTAGALNAARKYFDSTLIVYYGDVLTDLNLSDMINFHFKKRSICTIALSRSVPIDYGLAKVGRGGKVLGFEEKPTLPDRPFSMGIFIFEPKVLSYCGPNKDIAKDVIPVLVKRLLPVYGYVTSKRHYDIGNFKSLDEVAKIFSGEAMT